MTALQKYLHFCFVSKYIFNGDRNCLPCRPLLPPANDTAEARGLGGERRVSGGDGPGVPGPPQAVIASRERSMMASPSSSTAEGAVIGTSTRMVLP